MDNDENTSLSRLRDAYRTFATARNWKKYHDPKNVSASLVLEACELMELFQWDKKRRVGKR